MGSVAALLYINQGEGTNLKVYRSWSDNYSTGYLSSGDIVDYETDIFEISVSPLDGYVLDYYDNDGVSLPFLLDNLTRFESGGTASEAQYRYTLTYPSNGTVTATAKLINVTSYTLTISQGANSTITVARESTKKAGATIGTLSNGATIYEGDVLTITCSIDSGYDLTAFTVNGNNFTSGSTYVVSGAVAVKSTTAVKSNGTLVEYQCYIDTEYTEYPETDSVSGMFEEYSCCGYISDDDYTWMDGSNGVMVGYQSTLYYTSCLKFNANFIGKANSITITLNKGTASISTFGVFTIGYALCTSDANKDKYIGIKSSVTDQYQIASGTFDAASIPKEITIATDELVSGQAYYLFLWTQNKMAYRVNLGAATNHSYNIAIAPEAVHGIRFEQYQPYIDTGTSWEPYNIYIETI